MRLANITEKIKTIPDLPKDIFILVLIFLVGIGSYMLGREGALSERKVSELRILESTQGPISNLPVPERPMNTKETNENAPKTIASTGGMYVGSRSGTTYHLPWCSGAKRIKEVNKVWFQSKAEAVAKGYHPATNCEGI